MTEAAQSRTNKIQWLTGYEEIATVLASKAFAEVTFKGLVPLLGHTIVTLEGEAHHQRRSLEGRLFVSNLLKQHEEGLIPEIIQTTLEPYLKAGRGDLVEIGQQVTSRIAAQVIGLDGLEDQAATEEIVYLLSALVGGTSSTHGERTPLTRRQARNRLKQDFIDPNLERRRRLVQQYKAALLTRESLPRDLITLLLLHRDNWTLPQIVAEVAFYAVAAVDTTATLIPHLMHELWRYGEKYPESLPRFSEPKFLRAAAAEALRLHPVLPTLFRQATHPINIAGRYFVANEVVGLYIGKANQDKRIFGPGAGEFNPLRTVAAGIRRAGLSFGGGVHLCMGRELAIGTPDGEEEPALFGEAGLLAEALLRHGARPDPTFTAPTPQLYQRDVFSHYPIIFEG
jgi:cytochrome P450